MYFLNDSSGNTVRALSVENVTFYVVQRLDNLRIEVSTDLNFYKKNEIPVCLLETIEKNYFLKNNSKIIQIGKSHLTLVKETESILKNVELQSDNAERFKDLLVRCSLTASTSLVVVFILGLLFKPKVSDIEKLEIVQVIDRQQQPIVVKPSEKAVVPHSRPITKTVAPTLKKKLSRIQKATPKTNDMLSALGSLNKSKFNSGLKLEQIKSSAGAGLGGLRGSGGIQTTNYAKGLFSAALGPGSNNHGAGGYGTKGKGGGNAGYGKIQVVGKNGDSFFQSMDDEAFVGGGLDRSEIAAVIKRHISEVRFCYEKGLQQKPRLAGRLSMKFFIGPQGLVTTANVDSSSLGHAVVENCIRDRLKSWNFPQPQGGVTVKVTYPFILRRVSDT